MYHVGVSNIFELLGDEGEEGKRVAAAKAAQQQAAAKAAAPVVKETPRRDAAPGKAFGKGDNNQKPRSDRPPRTEGQRRDGQGERRVDNRPPRGDRPPRDGPLPEKGDRPPRHDRPDNRERKAGEFKTGTKRVYDRRSGTGRGKEIKKGGGGKGNWGKETDTWEENPQENADKAATPAVGDAPEGEAKVEAVEELPPRELTEEEKKQKEQEEKEAKWIGMDDFQKKKEEGAKGLPQLPPPRQAGEGVDKKEASKWASHALARDEDEASAKAASDKKEDEKKSKKNFVPVSDVLAVRQPRTPKEDRPERGDRGDRGDRGNRGDRGDRGSRGGRGGKGGRGGRGGAAAPSRGGNAPAFVNDANSFPTLSTTKA